MAIPSKQIGYSKEASLLYEILKKLDKLIAVTASISSSSTTTTTTTT